MLWDGSMEGKSDIDLENATDGNELGFKFNVIDGAFEDQTLDDDDETSDELGASEGAMDEDAVGGSTLGLADGGSDGLPDNAVDGNMLGVTLTCIDASLECFALRIEEATLEG